VAAQRRMVQWQCSWQGCPRGALRAQFSSAAMVGCVSIPILANALRR
jgi:hypothetical protein